MEEKELRGSAYGRAYLRKHPYIVFFIIAGTFLFGACVNLHSALISRGYTETTGYVSDLEEVRTSRHEGTRISYNYNVTWYDDGEEYTKYFKGQVEPREEGEVTVWVAPNNKRVVFHNGTDLISGSVSFWVIGFLAGAIGIFLYRRHVSNRDVERLVRSQESPEQRKKRLEQRAEKLEDTKLYTLMGIVFSLIGGLILAWAIYKQYQQEGYINPLLGDVFIVIAVIVVVCVVLFIRAKKQLEELER